MIIVEKQSSVVRRIAGTALGIVAAALTIAAVEAAGHALLPGETDPANATLPMLKLVLLAWTLGMLVGGALAALLTGWRTAPMVVAGFILAGIAINSVTIGGPLWLTLAGVAFTYVAGSFLRSRVQTAGSDTQRVAL